MTMWPKTEQSEKNPPKTNPSHICDTQIHIYMCMSTRYLTEALTCVSDMEQLWSCSPLTSHLQLKSTFVRVHIPTRVSAAHEHRREEALYLRRGCPGPTWSPGARSERPCAPPDSRGAGVLGAPGRAAGGRPGAAPLGREPRPWAAGGGPTQLQSLRRRSWGGEGAAPGAAGTSISPPSQVSSLGRG